MPEGLPERKDIKAEERIEEESGLQSLLGKPNSVIPLRCSKSIEIIKGKEDDIGCKPIESYPFVTHYDIHEKKRS